MREQLAGRTWAEVSTAGVEKFSAKPVPVNEAEDILQKEKLELLDHVEQLQKVLEELDRDLPSSDVEPNVHPEGTGRDSVDPSLGAVKDTGALNLVAHSEADLKELDGVAESALIPHAEEMLVTLASVKPAENAAEPEAEIAPVDSAGDVKPS